jgi:hypothetical protein
MLGGMMERQNSGKLSEISFIKLMEDKITIKG